MPKLSVCNPLVVFLIIILTLSLAVFAVPVVPVQAINKPNTISAVSSNIAQSDTSGNVTLAGTVKDYQNNLLANSEVQIIDRSTHQVSAFAYTNSNGYYSISYFPGTYDIEALPPAGSGLQATSYYNYTVSGSYVLNFILSLTGYVTFSGKIIDPFGNGVANQYISLNGLNGNGQMTDSSGAFSFQVVPGSYQISISDFPSPFNTSSGNIPPIYYINTTANLSLSQSQSMNITIPECKVTVHVQDPQGNPVANANVYTSSTDQNNLVVGNLPAQGQCSYVPSNSTYPPLTHPFTDAAGNAILWLFPTSNGLSYTICATPPAGTQFATTSLSGVSVTSDCNLSITLVQGITISGTIKDAQGNGLPNQQLNLNSETDGYYSAQTSTDSLGHYSLQVTPGDYQLNISGQQSSTPVGNVPENYSINSNPDLSLSESQNIDITLPVNEVNIHVQDSDGNPQSGVAITCSNNYSNNSFFINNENAYISSSYSDPVITDAAGNASLWLFTGSNYYGTFTATPPPDSKEATTNLSGVTLTSDNFAITLV